MGAIGSGSGFYAQRKLTPESIESLRRLQALALGAIRRLYPSYAIWRDFAYEYEHGRLAIDVINGGPALREWVDDAAAAPGDLDALAARDETAWRESVAPLLLYRS